MKKLAIAALVCLMATMIAGSAGATVYSLADLNSQVVIDTAAQGAQVWSVDGVDHLTTQWWYYRLGGAPGTTNPIDALSFAGGGLTDTDFDGINDNLVLIYAPTNGAWDVRVSWTLVGGSLGSGVSDMGEAVRINNYGPNALNLSLFEYNDFEMNNTAGGDNIMRISADTVRQWEGAVSVRETVVKTPSYWQIGLYSNVAGQIASGNNLTNQFPALYNIDAAWAYQWDVSLNAGKSDTWSKNKRISTAIPEWNSLFLAAIGMVGTIGIRRRRR